MTKVLITGANGALAKKVINNLSKDSNFKIIVSTRNPENISEPFEDIEYISNQDLIETDILKNVDFILHTAFPRTFEVKDMFDATIFFEAILHKSIDMGVKNFINISSQSIYGNYRNIPSSEIGQVNPQDIYALTKYQCELLGLALTRNENINYTNIRLASLIGSEFPERVINKMIGFAMQNKALTVQNDKNVFGFLHINDAAEGLCEFIKNSNPTKWNSIYNLGAISDCSENLEYISHIIKQLCSSKNIQVDVTVTPQEKAGKLCLMNSTAFYEISNWKPKLSLKESIKSIFEETWSEIEI